MGFEYFMSKSELKSMKCYYENSKDYLVDILNYADMLFLILRKDVDSQIKSYKKVSRAHGGICVCRAKRKINAIFEFLF